MNKNHWHKTNNEGKQQQQKHNI